MGEHTSYHQSIPGEEAKRRLELFDSHCYLTRYSDESKCYVLSVFQKQKPKDTILHFKIEKIKDDRKLRIEGKEDEDEEFDNIGQLLAHYEQNRIHPALRSIGRNCTEQEYQEAEKRRERKCIIL